MVNRAGRTLRDPESWTNPDSVRKVRSCPGWASAPLSSARGSMGSRPPDFWTDFWRTAEHSWTRPTSTGARAPDQANQVPEPVSACLARSCATADPACSSRQRSVRPPDSTPGTTTSVSPRAGSGVQSTPVSGDCKRTGSTCINAIFGIPTFPSKRRSVRCRTWSQMERSAPSGSATGMDGRWSTHRGRRPS